MKLKGLKKAVGDYQRANAGGYYHPRYGVLMLDRSTGELWTDEFYNLGHNSWKEYHDSAIIRVDAYPSMACVKRQAIVEIVEYQGRCSVPDEYDRINDCIIKDGKKVRDAIVDLWDRGTEPEDIAKTLALGGGKNEQI